jgi:hypothetical protein
MPFRDQVSAIQVARSSSAGFAVPRRCELAGVSIGAARKSQRTADQQSAAASGWLLFRRRSDHARRYDRASAPMCWQHVIPLGAEHSRARAGEDLLSVRHEPRRSSVGRTCNARAPSLNSPAPEGGTRRTISSADPSTASITSIVILSASGRARTSTFLTPLVSASTGRAHRPLLTAATLSRDAVTRRAVRTRLNPLPAPGQSRSRPKRQTPQE